MIVVIVIMMFIVVIMGVKMTMTGMTIIRMTPMIVSIKIKIMTIIEGLSLEP